jgi:HPt (histidine-containing phosphotransfer) domain-containing protein
MTTSRPTVFQVTTMDRLRCQLGDRGDDLVNELIALYLVQGRELVGQIEAAGEALDVVELKAAAHKLKGSTATLGGDRLAAFCQEILGAPPVELDVDRATQDVRREFEQLTAELVRYRSSLTGKPGSAEAI